MNIWKLTFLSRRDLPSRIKTSVVDEALQISPQRWIIDSESDFLFTSDDITSILQEKSRHQGFKRLKYEGTFSVEASASENTKGLIVSFKRYPATAFRQIALSRLGMAIGSPVQEIRVFLKVIEMRLRQLQFGSNSRTLIYNRPFYFEYLSTSGPLAQMVSWWFLSKLLLLSGCGLSTGPSP